MIKFVQVNVLEQRQETSFNVDTGSISANVPFRAAAALCFSLSCANDPADNL